MSSAGSAAGVERDGDAPDSRAGLFQIPLDAGEGVPSAGPAQPTRLALVPRPGGEGVDALVVSGDALFAVPECSGRWAVPEGGPPDAAAQGSGTTAPMVQPAERATVVRERLGLDGEAQCVRAASCGGETWCAVTDATGRVALLRGLGGTAIGAATACGSAAESAVAALPPVGERNLPRGWAGAALSSLSTPAASAEGGIHFALAHSWARCVRWMDAGRVVRSLSCIGTPTDVVVLGASAAHAAGAVVVAESHSVALHDVRAPRAALRDHSPSPLSALSATAFGGSTVVAAAGSGPGVRVWDVRMPHVVDRWGSPVKYDVAAVRLQGHAALVGGWADIGAGAADAPTPAPADAGPPAWPRGWVFGTDAEVLCGAVVLPTIAAGAAGSGGARGKRGKRERGADGPGAAAKPVGSGPPGGATGRLRLNQESGFRGLAPWVGADLCPVRGSGAVVVGLGADSSLFVAERAQLMIPLALR